MNLAVPLRWFALVVGLVGACSTPDPDPVPGPEGSGGGAGAPGGALGARCERDCGEGLECLLESEPFLGDGGPPGGLCSKGCADASDCGDNGLCVETRSGNRCVPRCEFGGEADKCGGREELSCAPILVPAETSCDDDEECPEGARCFEGGEGGEARGVCEYLVSGCLPRCGGDFDCGGGRFCDLGSGECVSTKPDGLAAGAPCDPTKAECAGVCVDVVGGVGECEERCRVGADAGCGVEALEGASVVCGFFAFDVGDVAQGAGDTGVCVRLCDCNDECPFDQRCLSSPVGDFAGLCASAVGTGEDVSCEGAGGAGGAP